MDIETYNRREKMLKLREELLAVEEDRMAGNETYKVIVSDRAKQMPGTHIRFMA